MLNRINKFLPPRQLRIPLIGLLLILGVIGERAKPVLSSQFANLHFGKIQGFQDSISSYTEAKPNFSLESEVTNKEARLRKALAKSASVPSKVAVESTAASAQTPDNQETNYTWLQRNPRLDSAPFSEQSTQRSTATLPAELEVFIKSAPKASTPKSTIESKAKFPRQNGVYLYGQSPEPGQFGQGYILFEKRQGQVIGALYMPSSEFSCFKGTLDPSGELAMTVRGYPGEISPSQLAARDGLPKVSDDEPFVYDYSVVLQDYHQLKSISASDRRMLQVCKTNLQN